MSLKTATSSEDETDCAGCEDAENAPHTTWCCAHLYPESRPPSELEKARAVLARYEALEHYPCDEVRDLGEALRTVLAALDGN